MNNWKLIHSDFTSQLQNQWERNNFTYNQTQDWINIGLTPDDCSFAVYLRDYLKCEPEEALNFANPEELRTQYQEYLQSQNEENEENQLARAAALSLGIFNFDINPSKGLTDEEAEQYLTTKRLNLKKYFAFSLGKEVQALPEEKEVKHLPNVVTLRDADDNILGVAANVRRIQPLLAEHLTQLFNDGSEKKFIAFAGKNTNQPSLAWTGDKLDQKIRNGEEVYVVFDKRRIKANLSYVRGKCLLAGFLPCDSIVALAAEASPQVRVFQSKKNALKFLRENEFKCRAVSCKEGIVGEQDYCLYHQTCLAKLEEREKNIPNIQEIDTFEAWFNGNCGYVIDKDSTEYPFHIWLVIYEPKYKWVKEEIFPMKFWKSKSLVRAHNKAQEVKKKLEKGTLGFNPFAVANPFCLIHWKADKYTTFDDLTDEIYVRKINLPPKVMTSTIEAHHWGQGRWGPPHGADYYETVYTFYPNETPENFLKPLDVVWVKKNFGGIVDFYHVGVYLGNNKFCHFSSYKSKKREESKTIITGWEEFIQNWVNGEIFAYHPVLPFKHYELIAQQIDWAHANEYDKGWYCLPNNNCEHHANSFVFGIDYSKQVKEREPLFWPRRCGECDSCKRDEINKGKGLTVKLTREIEDTNIELGRSTEHWYNQIKTEYEAKTVVKLVHPKDCKIM